MSAHTTRFLFPQDPSRARAVFEGQTAVVPHILAANDDAAEGRLAGASSLPAVSRSKPQQPGRLTAWGPGVPASDGLTLAHYKHYDVQLDWSEVWSAGRRLRPCRMWRSSQLRICACLHTSHNTTRWALACRGKLHGR